MDSQQLCLAALLWAEGHGGPFLPQLRTLGHGAHEREMAAVKPRAAVEPGRSPPLTSGLLACPMEAVERAGLW